jgi:hypothetical protein
LNGATLRNDLFFVEHHPIVRNLTGQSLMSGQLFVNHCTSLNSFKSSLSSSHFPILEKSYTSSAIFGLFSFIHLLSSLSTKLSTFLNTYPQMTISIPWFTKGCPLMQGCPAYPYVEIPLKTVFWIPLPRLDALEHFSHAPRYSASQACLRPPLSSGCMCVLSKRRIERIDISKRLNRPA